MNEQEYTPSENGAEELTTKSKERKQNAQSTLLIVACVLCGVSIILITAVPILLSIWPTSPQSQYPAINPNPTVQGEDISDDALEAAMDSTVIVKCGTSVGSGVVIRENGYILTNYHVVSGGDALSVILRGEDKTRTATLVGYSESVDIAVLKIEASLPIAAFASHDAVRYGEKVYAIGSPTSAEYGWSVTQGVVSCPAREIRIYDDEGKLEKKQTFLQTDAAVNHGSSGGPLINVRGEVVGIITLRHSKGEGMGFAIPSDKSLNEAIRIIENQDN